MQTVVYSKSGCPFCSLLKMELDRRGYVYTAIDLSDDTTRQEFYENTGTKSVPQVFLTDGPVMVTRPSGTPLGGWSEVSTNWHVFENA